ncbi:hypothetical protein F383_32077 [Gossypium arboreum]
MLYTS